MDDKELKEIQQHTIEACMATMREIFSLIDSHVVALVVCCHTSEQNEKGYGRLEVMTSASDNSELTNDLRNFIRLQSVYHQGLDKSGKIH
jgi:hypothetical protein